MRKIFLFFLLTLSVFAHEQTDAERWLSLGIQNKIVFQKTQEHFDEIAGYLRRAAVAGDYRGTLWLAKFYEENPTFVESIYHHPLYVDIAPFPTVASLYLSAFQTAWLKDKNHHTACKEALKRLCSPDFYAKLELLYPLSGSFNHRLEIITTDDALQYVYQIGYFTFFPKAKNREICMGDILIKRLGMPYLTPDLYDQEAVKWLKLATDKGDLQSQYLLAMCHLDRLKDQSQRWFDLLKKAADAGHDGASFRLSAYYLNHRVGGGKNWSQDDYEKAGRKLMKKAADAGYAEAQYGWGKVLMDFVQHQEAKAYFEKALKKKDHLPTVIQLEIKKNLALLACKLETQEGDQETIRLLKELIQENPKDQKIRFSLALLYRDKRGENESFDYQRACLDLLEKLALEGYVDAIYELLIFQRKQFLQKGEIEGMGALQDSDDILEQQMEQLEHCATEGKPEAASDLAFIYQQKGELELAEHYAQLAIQRNYRPVFSVMGSILFDKFLQKKSGEYLTQAADFFKKNLDRKDPKGMLGLSKIYLQYRTGGDVNWNEATYLKKAKSLYHQVLQNCKDPADLAEAYHNLGLIALEESQEDFHQAKNYFLKAVEKGNAESLCYLLFLEDIYFEKEVFDFEYSKNEQKRDIQHNQEDKALTETQFPLKEPETSIYQPFDPLDQEPSKEDRSAEEGDKTESSDSSPESKKTIKKSLREENQEKRQRRKEFEKLLKKAQSFEKNDFQSPLPRAKFEVTLDKNARKHWQKLLSCSEKVRLKVSDIIKELGSDPFTRGQHVETLSNGNFSRRITDVDRLVYSVKNKRVTIQSILGHYE